MSSGISIGDGPFLEYLGRGTFYEYQTEGSDGGPRLVTVYSPEDQKVKRVARCDGRFCEHGKHNFPAHCYHVTRVLAYHDAVVIENPEPPAEVDESEDALVALLQAVQSHPDANAILAQAMKGAKR